MATDVTSRRGPMLLIQKALQEETADNGIPT
jgi:hypothetical protein